MESPLFPSLTLNYLSFVFRKDITFLSKVDKKDYSRCVHYVHSYRDRAHKNIFLN